VNALAAGIAADASALIDAAACRLYAAKAEEVKARNVRIAAEEALIALVGAKQEGATSLRGSRFKVTTTGSLTRSVDAEALAAIKSEIPDATFAAVFRWKPDVVLRELRAVEASNPNLYSVIAQAITVKPAKTAVSVEPISE
jgi:hypothetical protein